jgi:hypothetical protein
VLVASAVRPGQFLYGIDAAGGYYNLRGVVGRALAEGRLPVWEPHAMCGAPLLASMHAAVFYPLTWTAAVLGPASSWTFGILLHLILVGIFTEAWLRRGLGRCREAAAAGAILVQCSAFMAIQVFGGHLAHLSTVAWAPAVLWRLERFLAGPSIRRSCLLALSLTLMILAGLPQFVMILAVAVVARLVQAVLADRIERRARAWVAAGAIGSMALGVAMAAPQLLPTLELLGQGQRASLRGESFAGSYSSAPLSFLTLLAPSLFGNGRDVPWWGSGSIGESPGFVGLSGLALGALGLLGRGPFRRLWAALALLAVTLAMGGYTPLFSVWTHLVPGAGLFRVAARYLFLFTLSMAPLASLGFERLWTGDPAVRRQGLWVAGAAALLALAGGAIGFSLDEHSGWWNGLHERVRRDLGPEEKPEARPAPGEVDARRHLSGLSLRWMAATGAVLAAALFAYRPSRGRARGTAAAVGLLLATELLAYDSGYFQGYSTERMEFPPGFEANVRSHPKYPFRLATVSPDQMDTIGMCQAAGLDHVGGYDPMMLRRYTELVNVALGRPASDLIVAMTQSRPGPIFDLLGARYWIVPGERQEPPGWRTVGGIPSFGFVYENPRALPRAFLVGRNVRIESAEERLRYLAQPTFEPSRVVVLENGTSGEEGDTDSAAGSVRIEAMGPGSYDVRIDSPRDAWLVLSEAWYPGWTAEIDGRSAELLRADHLFQTVRVSSGAHEVRFRYRSRYLAAGFAITAVELLIFAGLLLFRRMRRPARQSPPAAA